MEIKHRFTESVLFSLETDSLKLCIEAAVKSKINLGGADLRGADLRDANLGDVYLGDAYLRDANLKADPDEIARLDTVREIILAQPERLNMSLWHGEKWNPDHTPEEEHSCGTPHCLA